MSAQLQQNIERFLSSGDIANLATVQGDRPHVSAVEYVSRGLTIYFVSLPDTQKVANLEANPSVAIAINGPGRKRQEITGVQYFGRAERVDEAEHRDRVKTLFFDKYLLEPASHWFKRDMVFFEVTPERIDLIDYARGFGHKERWTRPT